MMNRNVCCGSHNNCNCNDCEEKPVKIVDRKKNNIRSEKVKCKNTKACRKYGCDCGY